MEVCNLPRGKGKTTYLIYRSHITNAPIICMSLHHVNHVKEMAKELGITIPEPISINDYMNNIYTNSKEKPYRVLVDEAPYVLGQILGTIVDTVTLSEHEN